MRGLSLQAVADAATRGGVPVTKQAVADYVKEREEGERKKIPGDFLAALCKDLGLSPWWLLLGVGQPDDPSPDADAYRKGLEAGTAPILRAADEAKAMLRRAKPAPDEMMERVDRNGNGG